MRSSTFLNVSLTVLALACVPASSRAEVLWFFDYWNDWTMGVYSQRLNPVSPEVVLRGQLPAPGSVGEVAVLQGVIGVGDQVPLPTYADGTLAQENEIFWTTHLWAALWPNQGGSATYRSGDFASATFSGRTLVGAAATINNSNYAQRYATSVEVLVTVIAVRGSMPTSTNPPVTFGGVKARYRGGREPQDGK